MARKLYLLLILLIFSLNPNAYCSHLYGGELLYQHISGNLYRIQLFLYGDCGTPQQGLQDSLMYARPTVHVIYDQSNGLYRSIDLKVDSANSNIDVTPVCPAQKNNTKCVSLNGTIPGIKRYIYQDTVTLPPNRWRMVFEGALYVDPNNPNFIIGAGRTQSITNLSFDWNVSQVMYLKALLNNTSAPNSSPVYTGVPTPFYCVNVSQQYNQGATDPDGDSLAFELVSALTNGTPSNYMPPYTPTAPMSTSSFSYSNINGQMVFTPDVIQRPLIVNEVVEYKNGVLVGSSMREMTFIILANCNNQPPDGNLATTGTSINGGINQGNNVVNVCSGTAAVSFNWSPTDPNAGDSITLTAYNVPTGAVLNITNNNTPNPTADFTWNLTGMPAGIYTFYINYKDNGCPLNTNQTVAYTIQVAPPYTINATAISSTECAHQAAVQINTAGGILPRIIKISDGNGVIKTLTDNTGSITDSLPAGIYTLEVSSPYFSCTASTNLTITDDGQFPFLPAVQNISVCQNGPVTPLNVTSYPGATLQWYDVNNNPLPGEPVYSTGNTATYTWQVSQQLGICLSEKTPVGVTINSNPQIDITNTPGKVCYADRVYLTAIGAQSYTWLPADKFLKDEEGRQYAMITEPITLTVVGLDNNVCKDTATITYTQIEQCCNFAYPNAFTPNGDNKNEKFRPVMYGNMEEYELNIYNRFGERVYQGTDARSGWDGKYKGQLCDVGMYFFRVKAKCYTGQKEENSGVVYLLR